MSSINDNCSNVANSFLLGHSSPLVVVTSLILILWLPLLLVGNNWSLFHQLVAAVPLLLDASSYLHLPEPCCDAVVHRGWGGIWDVLGAHTNMILKSFQHIPPALDTIFYSKRPRTIPHRSVTRNCDSPY